MSRIRRSALLGIATLVAGLVPATAAEAAGSADTTVTFTVSAGSLDITAPPTVDLGAVAAGTTVTGQIGPVVVTDTRGAVTADWEATVATTTFVNGTDTIPQADVSYWSGPTTASTPATGFTPGQPTAGDAVVLTGTVTAFSHAGTGGNTATWDPTLAVDVPLTALAGVYTGTVTHSVS
jgi:hypothetical protein